MAINFKLNSQSVTEATDPWHRKWVGWDERRTEAEMYELNRGVWILGPRARRERYATFSADGRIKMVIEISGIEDVQPTSNGGRVKQAIVGRVLTAGDAAYDGLIGRPVDGFRNPVTYIDDPDARAPTCACGCSAPVPEGRDFLSGHDQRAVRERISRQWGSTVKFIAWFDATYPEADTPGGQRITDNLRRTRVHRKGVLPSPPFAKLR